MRWVVYTLLALNLGLLTWNLQGQASAPGPAAQDLSALAPSKEEREALPLLSEIDDRNLRSRPSQVAVVEPTPSPAAPETSVSEAAPTPAPEPGPEAKSTPPAPAPGPSEEPGSEAAPEPNPAEPASTPDEATTTPAETLADAAKPDPGPSPSDASRGPRTCMTLGPLEDKIAIPEIRAWLEARGAEVDVRTDERREVALYWVFLPPRATREVAIEEVVRMKEQGIKDIIVVPKGDMANAISLGVYSRPESRDRRLKELNSKGYQPSIGPRYRTKVASWVDVSVDGGALDSEAIEARWPGVRVTPSVCPGVPTQAAVGASTELPVGTSAETADSAAGASTPGGASGGAAANTAPGSKPNAQRFLFSGQGSEQ